MTTKSKSNSHAGHTQRANHLRHEIEIESPREMTHDLSQYIVNYAHRNPGYAALYCLGIGFVLGWKLKPW